MTVNLGKGSYDSRNGTASYTWATNNQDFNLNTGSFLYGSGAIFDVGTAAFRPNFEFTNLFKGKNFYVNETGRFSEADRQRILDINPDAEFRSIEQFQDGTNRASFVSTAGTENGVTYTVGQVRVTSSGRDFADQADQTVTFWNVRKASVNSTHAFASTIRFDGVQNYFSDFSIGGAAKLVVASNSNLRGNITVGSGGLMFESGARATGGTISAASGGNLVLTFASDFVQSSSDSSFTATGATLVVKTDGNSLRLLNRGNGFSGLRCHKPAAATSRSRATVT